MRMDKNIAAMFRAGLGAPPNRPRAEPGPARLGDVLQEYLGVLERARGKGCDGIDALWKEIVPPTVAQGTRVMRMKGGTLYVEVKCDALRHELEVFGGGMLLEKIRAKGQGRRVERIKFKLGTF